MPISRRNLIASTGFLLAAARPVRAAPEKRVIVVGSGFSGLAAARALSDKGADVVVVEARERIGGRIFTSRQWADLPVDLGASWIHGVERNPLTALADHAKVSRIATRYESAIAIDADGKDVDLTAAYERAERLMQAARAAVEKEDRDLSLEQAMTRMAGWRKADMNERRLIRHVVNGKVEAEYGGSWSEESALNFDASEEFDGEDALPAGGFHQLIDFLARGLEIRTGAVVDALSPDKDGVSLTLRGGDVLKADHVVLTVPLGVLKKGDIQFSEPLQSERQAAIAALGMGLLNKCFLRFDKPAWPADVDWIEWVGPEVGVWAEWVSLLQAAKLPVLIGFHAGDQARAMEKLSDADMAESAHAALKAMFGSDFPAPSAVQVTRWSQDPFTHGSYSFNPVGATRDHRVALAGTDWGGRLVFAGEACEPDYWGTAHGALMSGRSAAKLIQL